MRQLRSDPTFAPLFRHVHPLCWPILWWSLNRVFKWYDTSGYENVLLATTRWGYVYPAYLGQKKPDPSAYKPYELEKPRWDDPVWSTNVPAPFLITNETLRPHPHPPLRSGGGCEGLAIALQSPGAGALRALTEGACALTPHNTS
ncbi:hypothetical protein [Hyphomonas sp.]|uniref:hypothetical protein n=1 Tax=Hyphomonas sp. TaxID=87 RepID=UPI00391CD32F